LQFWKKTHQKIAPLWGQLFTVFKESGEAIRRNSYMIDGYRISHSETSWGIRGSVRQLFGLIWGTGKLLTNVLSPP
jgi:hypothetical protein